MVCCASGLAARAREEKSETPWAVARRLRRAVPASASSALMHIRRHGGEREADQACESEKDDGGCGRSESSELAGAPPGAAARQWEGQHTYRCGEGRS